LFTLIAIKWYYYSIINRDKFEYSNNMKGIITIIIIIIIIVVAFVMLKGDDAVDTNVPAPTEEVAADTENAAAVVEAVEEVEAEVAE
jgi:heme/copper-type cytochrome/quinol oxidase subunit 2